MSSPAAQHSIKSNSSTGILPYDPNEYPRETPRHYISASDSDIVEMMDKAGVVALTDELREADVSNPKGYYEYEPVKLLPLVDTFPKE